MTKKKTFDINDAQSEALEVVKDKRRMEVLLATATLKLQSLVANTDKMAHFVKQLKLSIKMLKAAISGEYKNLSVGTIVSLVAGLLYFICPVDLVPDFIPVVGYVDDISILIWVFRNLSSEIEMFEKWQTKVAENRS